MYKFNSQIQIGADLPYFHQEQIKIEPMLFGCNFKTANAFGGLLTSEFLFNLSPEFRNAPDLIIDSRVHMLMPDWFPAIPGFHHDDVPREREDGQPNYRNPSYKAQHCMALFGDCCPTEFAIGESEFPEVPMGEKYYKVWHPLVLDKIKNNQLQSLSAPINKMIYFDWQTWHQGIGAVKNGWRFFIRATIYTKRKPMNELRRQVQVYLKNPMEGW